jgi:hypothetical protein
MPDEWAPSFAVGQRVRISDTYPNIRWAGMYGRIMSIAEHARGELDYRIVLEEGNHPIVITGEDHITDVPERHHDTVTGRFAPGAFSGVYTIDGSSISASSIMMGSTGAVGSGSAMGVSGPSTVSVSSRYTARSDDVLLYEPSGRVVGLVDAQIPLGECAVHIKSNGVTRRYRFVEERDTPEEPAGPQTPTGRRLKI